MPQAVIAQPSMDNELMQEQDIKFAQNSMVDDVGRVFFWQGRVFRGIYAGKQAQVRDLFDSGLLRRLTAAQLFPTTTITDYTLPDFPLILEHERIWYVTYPYEWSFKMLRAAALTVLEINEIAASYGYQTKDCHAYNVMFVGNRPRYVDLGSFIKYPEGGTIWEAYGEFHRQYLYPLTLWRDGNEHLARSVLVDNGILMPIESFWLYRHPMLRRLPQKRVKQAARAALLSRYLRGRSPDDLRQKMPGRRGQLFATARKLLPTFKVDFGKLRRKVEKLKLSTQAAMWENYHISSGLLSASGEIQPSPRFKRIGEIVNELGIQSVTELAGNQGVFARYLLQATGVERVICTDYESSAIDTLYDVVPSDSDALAPVVLNFVRPKVMTATAPPAERLQSQAVIALAVTHHLLLTQGESIDHVLTSMLAYASDYILVEFMPLGLFDGKNAPPFPDWYSADWFAAACQRHFDVLSSEQLEENRILFVGKLRA